MRKQYFICSLVFLIFSGCAAVDPADELLNRKAEEITGVWVWVNTKYPTPFGNIVVSSLNSGTIYKVVFTGNEGEIFRQNHLVQKVTFDIRRGRNNDFILEILTKKELETSSIDMLGGKILLNGRELTLDYQTATYESQMLLNKMEIF